MLYRITYELRNNEKKIFGRSLKFTVLYIHVQHGKQREEYKRISTWAVRTIFIL